MASHLCWQRLREYRHILRGFDRSYLPSPTYIEKDTSLKAGARPPVIQLDWIPSTWRHIRPTFDSLLL